MKVVWGRSPASARDVLEVVEGETSWAYATVKTILNRLVEKGALTSRRRANTNLYEPVVSRTKALRSAIHAVVDQAFDGAFGPLLHFLVTDEHLSGREREQLMRLLEDEERTGD